jgi:hypothetical protein
VSAEVKKILGYPVGKKIIFVLLVFFIATFVSGNGGAFLIEIPFRLLCGWAIHGWKALPPFFEKWQAAVLPIGCLLSASVIAHRFVNRWVDEKFPERIWGIRHTTAALSLLPLGSAAAIALSGVVHQMFWLAGGKVIESNRRADLTEAISNGKQLMLALVEFQNKNGRYPVSFEELVPEIIQHPVHLRQLSWLGRGDDRVPEPWILLKPGSSEETIVPVIQSPIIRSGKMPMVVVGYSDASLRSFRADQINEIFGQIGIGEGEGGR